MNLYADFKKLIHTPQLQIGTVSAVISPTMKKIALNGGGEMLVRGGVDFLLNDVVFIRDGEITSHAPSLPTSTISI